MAAASAGRLAGGVLAAMAHAEDATRGTSRARGQRQPEPLPAQRGERDQGVAEAAVRVQWAIRLLYAFLYVFLSGPYSWETYKMA